jgi:hypothetical protein
MQVGKGYGLRRRFIEAECLAKDIGFKGTLRDSRAGHDESGGADNYVSEYTVVHQILSVARRANPQQAWFSVLRF